MYYDDSYPRRFGVSSAILLLIFVAAFALIVVAALWRPWAEGDDTEEVLPGISVEEAVPDEVVPVEAEAQAAPQ